MKNLFLFFILFVFAGYSFASPPTDVVLRQGIKISFELVNPVSAKEATDGQSITFKVVSDVIVDKKVVIRAGTIAKGEVMYAWPGTAYGGAGSIRIAVKNVTAVDNMAVFIVSENISRRGKSRAGLCFGLGLIPELGPIIAMCIKGQSPTIPAGTTCEGYVMVNTTVSVD